ncbi:MAG: hypothetical protein ABIT04_11030 [Novosphingobium sp.]
MGLFDGILSSVSEHADVGNLATRLGIPPELAEKAIAALGAAHQQPGDTVQEASTQTGIDPGILGQIVQQIGGEGSLGEFARMIASNPQAAALLGGLDKDGDGSAVDDLAGIAKGFFGKS